MKSELGQYVIDIFGNNIETTQQTAHELAQPIADCSTLIVQALLSEHKILCCGEGQSGALAQIFASNLLNRFDYERPSLPAMALNTDTTAITAITSDGHFSEIYAKQIRALGQSGDLLVVFFNDTNPQTAVKAIQAAHEQAMIVIAIMVNNDQTHNIRALMAVEDIELTIPSAHRARVSETQLLIINSLCELIDQQLFGGEL